MLCETAYYDVIIAQGKITLKIVRLNPNSLFCQMDHFSLQYFVKLHI